jgi:hypothetical protein
MIQIRSAIRQRFFKGNSIQHRLELEFSIHTPQKLDMVFTPPKSYAAYAFLEKGSNLQKITVDWKDPQPGEIIVKVLACGVCHRSVSLTVQDGSATDV